MDLKFLRKKVDVGSPVLARGDVVGMDNCGFHHGDFAEKPVALNA